MPFLGRAEQRGAEHENGTLAGAHASVATSLLVRTVNPPTPHPLTLPYAHPSNPCRHQIAFRPKTNSYDAFTEEQMRQEILDLALFGCNAIEMIPPGLDDAAQSPHFKVSWLDMLECVSEWCDDLDLRVSMWYPAFLKNWYFDEEKKKQVIAAWDEVFSHLKRFDVLFVPGGDPGGRPAKELFEIVEMQARHVRSKWFPKCEVWVSTQYGGSMGGGGGGGGVGGGLACRIGA